MRRPRTALVDTRVLGRRAPAVYVANPSEGEWRIGAPGFTDRAPTGFAAVSLERIAAIDPACAEVLDLRRGWHAWRRDLNQEWQRGRMPQGDMHLLTYEVRAIVPKH